MWDSKALPRSRSPSTQPLELCHSTLYEVAKAVQRYRASSIMVLQIQQQPALDLIHDQNFCFITRICYYSNHLELTKKKAPKFASNRGSLCHPLITTSYAKGGNFGYCHELRCEDPSDFLLDVTHIGSYLILLSKESKQQSSLRSAHGSYMGGSQSTEIVDVIENELNPGMHIGDSHLLIAEFQFNLHESCPEIDRNQASKWCTCVAHLSNREGLGPLYAMTCRWQGKAANSLIISALQPKDETTPKYDQIRIVEAYKQVH
ncbi:hypothetical protein VNO77_03266 [Canavalia gladiata]|uniref:Uncharacterized protein n=1 Tax=Canavalia gladiata TaxID=3824 RepID=A0AAN9RC26_CANGL